MNLLKLPDDHIACISQLQETCPSAVLQVLKMLKEDTAKVYEQCELNNNSGITLVIEYCSKNGEVRKVDLNKFVHRCARNLLVDEKRREKVLQDHGNRIVTFNAYRTPPEPDFDLLKEEQRQVVNRALNSLSPKLRETARLHWIKDKTVPEVARKLNAPAKTIYDRKARAKKLLKATLSSQQERN